MQLIPIKNKKGLLSNNKSSFKYRARFINNKWVVIDRRKNKIPIQIPYKICDELYYIFASTQNTYWETGKPAKHLKRTKANDPDYTLWAPLKENIQVSGIIVMNKFLIDWKKQDLINKDYYVKNNKNFRPKP